MTAIYTKHNPSKLKDVETLLLGHYAGREGELLRLAKKKYKIEL